MIVSASRRTDIPGGFFDWFLDRMRQGYVDVKNPFNLRQIRRVSLAAGDADLIVFWTKNGTPLLEGLSEFETFRIPCMVLYTITPYDRRVEPGIPEKDAMLDVFIRLADRLGPERVSWRYDPIILTPEYSRDYHLRGFETCAKRLEGRTRRCITSFVAPYKRVRGKLEALGRHDPGAEERRGLLALLAGLAEARGMALQTCGDETPPAEPPAPPIVPAGACIDPEIVSRLAGRDLRPVRDKHQRPSCLCAASVDIGTYGTCPNGCVYCYAGSGRGPDRAGEVKRPPDMLLSEHESIRTSGLYPQRTNSLGLEG
jgi:hypothetical protein